MKITVINYIHGAESGQITDSIKILNSTQNNYFFCLEQSDNLIVETEKINWISFCNEHSSEYDCYRIYITDKAFDDNYFSHEEAFFSVITTHNWNKLFAPPSLKAYILYQISQAVMNFSVNLGETDINNMYQKSLIGCLFDKNMYKTDIKYGMRSGKICTDCKSNLLMRGINKESIISVEQILQIVRSEAFGEPLQIPEKAAFIIMKYTKNDENEHGFQYGIKPALETLGIKSILANDFPHNDYLLEIIISEIKRCRFIIAKVDVDNEKDLRNVYFELGLAKGMGKDVIIICSDNYLDKLPADTRGLEHIPYPPGDYNMLKNNIIGYYTNKFKYLG